MLTAFSQPDYNSNVDDLANLTTTSIDQAIFASTQTLTKSQQSRRWWDTKTLNPLKGYANFLRQRAQHTNNPRDRFLYRASQNKFQQACKDAKLAHWRKHLADLSVRNLFTASKYTKGSKAPLTLPPLRKPHGQLTINPGGQANLLFQATGGPAILCELSSITPPCVGIALRC